MWQIKKPWTLRHWQYFETWVLCSTPHNTSRRCLVFELDVCVVTLSQLLLVWIHLILLHIIPPICIIQHFSVCLGWEGCYFLSCLKVNRVTPHQSDKEWCLFKIPSVLQHQTSKSSLLARECIKWLGFTYSTQCHVCRFVIWDGDATE